MSILVLSTLLHYIPIGVLVGSSQPAFIGYAAVISCSTTLSAVWHYLEEPGGAIQYADYGMAALWSMYTLQLLDERDKSKMPSSISFELFVGAANLMITLGTQYRFLEYKIWHTLWHILSAIKSMYFVWLLTHS